MTLLRGERHLEQFARTMLAMDDFHHLLDYIGMLGSHVMILMDIGCQVVQVRLTLLHHQLPVAHTHANLVRFMELPVQEVVLRLTVVLSQHRGSERNAVEAVAFELLVQILLGELLVAYQFAEGRHHIVEGQLMIVHRTGRHVSRPTDDKRNSNTTFVALALQSAQLAVASEECRIGTAFLVGAIVATEDNQRILVQSLLLQLGKISPT